MSQTYMLNLDTFKATPVSYGDRDEPIQPYTFDRYFVLDSDGADAGVVFVEFRIDAVGDVCDALCVTGGMITMPNGHRIKYGESEKTDALFHFLAASFAQTSSFEHHAEIARERLDARRAA